MFQDASKIIGLGGGSCMDAAKAIIILLVRPDLDPDGIITSDTHHFRDKAHLMAIPTTSGTGSEATRAIVLTDTEYRRKIGLGTVECTPVVAILDPEMVAGLPPEITADSGMDVVCQAIEGYVSTWGSTLTDGPGLLAARQALRWLPRAYENGAIMEARKEMQNAAVLAGLMRFPQPKSGRSYLRGNGDGPFQRQLAPAAGYPEPGVRNPGSGRTQSPCPEALRSHLSPAAGGARHREEVLHLGKQHHFDQSPWPSGPRPRSPTRPTSMACPWTASKPW